MTTTTDDREARTTAARESFSGRTLTESQFNGAWAVSGVLHGEIHRTGSFRDTLVDYAHAYARSKTFDALRGETILRDIYAGRYGETLNQTREGLLAQEEALPETARSRALTSAETIGDLIREAPTQPFYQAHDRVAVTLARELGITQTCAKSLMKEAFEATHGRDLYAAGKELEEAYHRPVREAEIAQRKAEKLQQRGRTQTRS